MLAIGARLPCSRIAQPSLKPAGLIPCPTMVLPLPDSASACRFCQPLMSTPLAASRSLSARSPSASAHPKNSARPPPSVRRNAASRDRSHAKPTQPTITWPSPETRLAALEVPPGRKPSPTMPIELVQRNASCSEFALVLTPTITEPSADTAFALLLVLLPPGRNPSPTRKFSLRDQRIAWRLVSSVQGGPTL